MNEALRRETEKLVRSWQHHDPTMLRDYLVADVEDPRLNVQSILTRHFLIDAITEGRGGALMEQELRFAVILNWLLELTRHEIPPEDFAALRHGLERGADNIEGLEVPAFARSASRTLPAEADGVTVPNYLRAFLDTTTASAIPPRLDPATLGLFASLWPAALDAMPRRRISVIEPACGSANDYRFIETFGLGQSLDYLGFDLCEANIANARTMFPRARFEVGNVFDVATGDKSFDLCVTHDLFEHLSPAGLERALNEVCRVTRHALCLGFFNMHEDVEHIMRPVDDYHWNTLSLERVRASLERHGFETEAIHIETFLKWRFACDRTHNPNAYTLLCRAAGR